MQESFGIYHDLVEIRSNQRFATFKALDKTNEPVFIKQIRSPGLQENLRKELYAIERMHETVKTLSTPLPFSIPKIISYGEDYLVTNWIEGETMAFGHDLDDQNERISFLAQSYAAIDRATQTVHPGLTNFTVPGKKNENAIQYLKRVIVPINTKTYFDSSTIDAAFTFLDANTPALDARFTHADFTPNNVMEHKNGNRTLIDWESGSERWPRFYDVVNFSFNWSLERPDLIPDMSRLLNEFFVQLETQPDDHINQLNTIAMLRAVSCITELMSEPNEHHNTTSIMTEDRAAFINSSIDRILSGRLYIDI